MVEDQQKSKNTEEISPQKEKNIMNSIKTMFFNRAESIKNLRKETDKKIVSNTRSSVQNIRSWIKINLKNKFCPNCQ